MNDDRIPRAFVRLQREVHHTIQPLEGLERLSARRSRRRVLVPAFGVAALAIAVVGAATMWRDEPGPLVTTGRGPDTTTPVPTTDVSGPDLTDPAVDAPTIVGPVVVERGDVLLAGPDGVAVEGRAGTRQLTDAPARVATGDRRGGVVFESQGRLWHAPAGSSAALLLLRGAELHDVAVIDGEPTVIFGRDEADPAEEVSTVVGIDLLGLDTGRIRPLFRSEGYEGGVTRVSYGGGAFVVTEAAEGLEWFTFVDVDGARLEVANPRPRDHEARFGDRFSDQAVLSADGARLAFLDSERAVLGPGDSVDLVVWDMTTGTEITRVELPSGDHEYWFVRMDVRGDEAVVGRLAGARESSTAVVVDLVTGATRDTSRRGMPSVVADAAPAPTSTATTEAAAPIPAEGLGRGHAIGDWERIVWHGEAARDGAPRRRVIVERARDAWSGQSWFVFDDLAGGLVYGDGMSPTVRLRPGASAPEVLMPGGVDGIPSLSGVARIDGEPSGYYVVHRDQAAELFTIGLDSRSTRSVGTIDLGSRGWITNVSYGGGRFLVSAVVDGCPSHLVVGPDGDATPFGGVPRTACTGSFTWTEQARLAPDGSLVAYVRARTDGVDPELGNVLLRQPVELVVADATDGEELISFDVGTPVQDVIVIHDFDGRRIVASRTAFEPAQAPWVTFVFDLACADCTERHDLIAAGGGLTGPAETVTSVGVAPVVPMCSAHARLVAEPAPAGLPAAVAETRAAILAAAGACDLDALDALALEGTFSHYFDVGRPGMFAESESRGPALLQMSRVLQMPVGTFEVGGETVYVWPSAAAYDSWDAVPVADKDALATILTPEDLGSFAELGGYYGLRVGITESGDWTFLTAGD